MCESCERSFGMIGRRRFLAAGAAAFVAGSFPAFAQEKPSPRPPQNAIAPQDALKRLMEGNARCVAGTGRTHDYAAGRDARVTAQYPVAAILSCADSRVAPELAFDQAPGDLFVVRIAGNFVEDGGLASLEYAVQFLGVPLLMVLGHSNCGAVAAAIQVLKEKTKLPGHLPGLIAAIKPSVIQAEKSSPSDLLAAATAENVRTNVQRLANAKPLLSAARAERRIEVVGGLYDLATGKVSMT